MRESETNGQGIYFIYTYMYLYNIIETDEKNNKCKILPLQKCGVYL